MRRNTCLYRVPNDLTGRGVFPCEAKLDGYRCLAGKDAGRVTLWSRRGTLFTPRFPEIARACEKLPPETVLDGEVVAIDDNGRASFNLLQHHRSKRHLQFYAFDLPVYRGRSLLNVPLEKRRALLEEALDKVDYPVLFSRTFDAKPADLIRAAMKLQLEGIIAKQKGFLLCARAAHQRLAKVQA